MPADTRMGRLNIWWGITDRASFSSRCCDINYALVVPKAETRTHLKLVEHNTGERIEPPVSLAVGCRNKARLNPIVYNQRCDALRACYATYVNVTQTALI